MRKLFEDSSYHVCSVCVANQGARVGISVEFIASSVSVYRTIKV